MTNHANWKPTCLPLTPHSVDAIRQRSGDPAYRAALHILTGLFSTDARVWRYVDLRPLPVGGIDFEGMLALENGSFSNRERRMLVAAASLWHTGRPVNLGWLVSGLDHDAMIVLIQAIMYRQQGALQCI